MAEEELQRQRSEMENSLVLDTSMSETSPAEFTASPLPQTSTDSRPPSQQPPQSPTDSDSDSGSDYSQPQSPASSRPTSTQLQNTDSIFEEVSLEDKEEGQRSSVSDDPRTETSNGSQLASIELLDNDSTAEGVDELYHTPTGSGSDYSEPSTPKTSRPISMMPAMNSESVALDDIPRTSTAATQSEPPAIPIRSPDRNKISQKGQQSTKTTPSQQWNSLVHSAQSPRQSGVEHDTSSSQRESLEVDTTVSRPDSLAESNTSTSEPPTPRITVSPLSQSPEGSNYSGSPPQSPRSASTPTVPVSPMTPQEAHMSIDSMQSIALSDTSLDYDHLSADQVDDVLSTPRVSGVRHARKVSSLEILQNTWGPPTRQSTLFDTSKDEPLASPLEESDSTSVWRSESSSIATPKRSSNSSDSDSAELDWSALDKTEEQEKEDRDLPAGVEDETTAFLLARLEQENAKFTADPKSASGNDVHMSKGDVSRLRSKSRPPSMAQLKRLVSHQPGQDEMPSIRYSLSSDVQEQLPLEEPPPMTELEFWAALVQDYPSTASRLPTLTTTKIRAGIPPPLRGVVWASMSGARKRSLEDAFERHKDESSPYEGIINKDIGRSFPGVEMFRDAEGEGQRMLGRVLKCFSLHDKDIGYCQGLGFLVGPLLMNMGEKESFGVLVRLMDHYALRPSFLPSLSGLHMRIFQFSTLLAQHHPELSAHLTSLGVEPAYLSQWFLSCFAVTCPLPMLFRIYDVIFAEGANETVMRVALALFRRNEAKMMASSEFEEVMQLLLGRALWDVYGCNADELVDDFTSLGGIITHARLQELEREFESKDGGEVGQSAGFLPDVQAAASRFLGRLWAPTHGHTPSKGAATTLSPQSAEKDSPGGGLRSSRPGSFLRRSPSKTSIITINESSNGSESSGTSSLASTAPTDNDVHDAAARESQADSASMKSKADSLRTVSVSTNHAFTATTPGMKEQQELHSQIEDLLMALSEMQREHAQLAAMLQKEREERNDDHRVVRLLLGRLGKGSVEEKKRGRRSMPPPARRVAEEGDADKRRTLPARPRPQVREMPMFEEAKETGNEDDGKDEGIERLVQEVQARLDSNARFSASFETKAQLRSTLARTREQLATAETQVKDLSERAEFSETSLLTFQNESESLHSEVEELRTRVNDDFKEKQKLELTIQNMEIQMRMEAKAVEKQMQKQRRGSGWLSRAESSGEVPTISKISAESSRSRNGSVSSAPGSAGGLRELKLGRRDSVGSVQSIRSMKAQRQMSDQWPSSPPTVNVSPSPPTGETTEVVAAPATPPAAPTHTPSASLSTPTPIASHARTSSLSTPAPLASHTRTSSLSAPAPIASHTRTSSLAAPAPIASHTRTSSLAAPAPVPDHKTSTSLSVPATGGFGRRTTSLATREVLATPEHEPVPEEALLLELVNAKTAEAQARQEVDELKKSLQVQKRRAEEAILQIQAEAASAQLEAEAAKADAEQAREEAMAVRAEIFAASPYPTGPFTPTAGFNFPVIPIPEEEQRPGSDSSENTPARKPEPRKADSTPASASSGGGWFWSRRTASTTKAVID